MNLLILLVLVLAPSLAPAHQLVLRAVSPDVFVGVDGSCFYLPDADGVQPVDLPVESEECSRVEGWTDSR